MLERGSSTAAPIVIANHWAGYLAGNKGPIVSVTQGKAAMAREVPFNQEGFRENYLDTMCKLATHRRVYIMKPVPAFDVNVPTEMARRLRANPQAADIAIDLAEYRKRNPFILGVMDEASRKCGIATLDPTRFLCPEGKCIGSHNGRPLYSDGNHMSEYGNRLLVPMFREIEVARIGQSAG
jgi:hypothetical protein